jgi:hypothetical protein
MGLVVSKLSFVPTYSRVSLAQNGDPVYGYNHFPEDTIINGTFNPNTPQKFRPEKGAFLANPGVFTAVNLFYNPNQPYFGESYWEFIFGGELVDVLNTNLQTWAQNNIGGGSYLNALNITPVNYEDYAYNTIADYVNFTCWQYNRTQFTPDTTQAENGPPNNTRVKFAANGANTLKIKGVVYDNQQVLNSTPAYPVCGVATYYNQSVPFPSSYINRLPATNTGIISGEQTNVGSLYRFLEDQSMPQIDIRIQTNPNFPYPYSYTPPIEEGTEVFLRRVIHTDATGEEYNPVGYPVDTNNFSRYHGDVIEAVVNSVVAQPSVGGNIWVFILRVDGAPSTRYEFSTGEDEAGNVVNNFEEAFPPCYFLEPFWSPQGIPPGTSTSDQYSWWQLSPRGNITIEPALAIPAVLSFEMQHALFPISGESVNESDYFIDNIDDQDAGLGELYITTGTNWAGNIDNTLYFEPRLTYSKFWYADGSDNNFLLQEDDITLWLNSFTKYIHLMSPSGTTGNFTIDFNDRTNAWTLNVPPKLGSNLVVRGTYEIY